MKLTKGVIIKSKLIIAFTFFAFLVVAQPKEYKLIQKQKFSKLESTIVKQLIKDSTNCRAHFLKGVLYNQKKFEKFSPEIAVKSFNKSLSEFYKLSVKDKEKYVKEGIITDTILYYRNVSFDFALDIAKSKNTIEGFDYFIQQFGDAQKQKIEAISQRNILAFEYAKGINTIESFDYFIKLYPESYQYSDAVKLRDNLAFEAVKLINTEDSYASFIEKYPLSLKKNEAILLRDKQAFDVAKQANNSADIIKFLKKYPQSHLKTEAEFEKNRLFFKEQTDGSISGYIAFCRKNEKSDFFNQAVDSIRVLSIKNFDIEGAQYLLKNQRNQINSSAFQDDLMDAFLFDGDLNTLSEFIENFEDYLDKNHLNRLETYSEKISLVKNLFLKIGITSNNEYEYIEFINSMAPSDIAFVALQRLIETDLNEGNWIIAKTKLQEYETIFQKQYFNPVTNLITILDKPDMLVKKEQIKGVNSVNEEYAPVPSIDGKKLFFCGKDRKDNIGGEDVFIATAGPKQVITSKLEESLSTPYGNEAPLSVSADGTTMFLYSNENSGDIMVSKIEKAGTWSTPIALPYPINTDFYESDAMLSADGKTLYFVSSRPGGQNLYSENSNSYFGDDNYPTDIYLSKLNENGDWSEPVNLGKSINTPYSERSPYIHPDGKTLYFSSEGHYGFGRLDVYKSTLQDESNLLSWSTPQNLGKEINTPQNNSGFKFSTDGLNGYYSAKRQSVFPSSLVLLLDISGSMKENYKIDAMKEAAIEVCLGALENNTEVAILAFEGECYSPIYDSRYFTNDAAELTSFISDLEPRGGTPMYEGLLVAADYLKDGSSASSKNKTIILLSDGDATSCYNRNELFKELKTKKLINKVYTIALQVDEYSQAYDDLKYIADNTGGEFFHAQTSNDLGNAFSQASNKIFNFSLKQSNSDVYKFNLPEELRPKLVSTIAGRIVDSKNQPLDAKIYWENLNTGEQIGVAKTNPTDGSYFIALPIGKNYGYYVDHPSYFPASNNVDLRNKTTVDEIKLNVDVVSYEEMINENKSVEINNLFFETAKFDLEKESFVELNRVVAILKRSKLEGFKIEISGHTDNVGTEEYNMKLSENRAKSVANYLISKGIDKSTLIINGYGFSKPKTDNNSEESRALNRRVELKFIK